MGGAAEVRKLLTAAGAQSAIRYPWRTAAVAGPPQLLCRGWCGSGEAYCIQAVQEPHNLTFSVWQRAIRHLPGVGLTLWEQGRKQARVLIRTTADQRQYSSQSFFACHTHGSGLNTAPWHGNISTVEAAYDLASLTASTWSRMQSERTVPGSRPVIKHIRCNSQRWIALSTLTGSDASSELFREKQQLAMFTGSAAGATGESQVLVVYHHFEKWETCEADEEIRNARINLLYFLRAAVREGDGVDYVINFVGRISSALLALVPEYANVRVRFVGGEVWSSDLCSFHQTLSEYAPELTQRYRYFFLINNGMRGPFAAPEHAKQHWTQPFTDLLKGNVHLAGPYISCEVKTHVQGPFLAADGVGIQHVMKAFASCKKDHRLSIVASEIGASQRVLADGHNIASLQREYAGLDFRERPTQLKCKGRLNPTFCCGAADPLQLHWIKYGGEVYRLGLLMPETIRLVEAYTAAALNLTEPLHASRKGQAPTMLWMMEQRQKAKRQGAGRLRTARLAWRRSMNYLMQHLHA